LDFGNYLISEDVYLTTQLLLIKDIRISYFPFPSHTYFISPNSLSRTIRNEKLISGHCAVLSSMKLIILSENCVKLRNETIAHFFIHMLHLRRLGFVLNYFDELRLLDNKLNKSQVIIVLMRNANFWVLGAKILIARIKYLKFNCFL
jgi:hypothetical protein